MTIIQCDLCHNTIDTMQEWITITVNADKGKGCHLDEDRDICHVCAERILAAPRPKFTWSTDAWCEGFGAEAYPW